MRKIRTATFVSLDGVMQAPGGPEEDPADGFRFGGWVFPFFDEALGGLMDRAMGEDYDLLLGRRTYEIFAGYWPHQDDEIARVFNAVNKYVVASPGTPMPWANSHLLEGDVVESVRALKETEGRDLLIQGSSQVIHALLAADLIDQMTLLTFPVVLGEGKRLFDAGSRPRDWTSLGTEATGKGVIVAAYRLGGEVATGSFAGDDVSEARQARRDGSRSEA